VADVPEPWRFTQLFVNGQRAHRSRAPREGTFTIERSDEEPVGSGAPEETDWSLQPRSFVYRRGDIDPRWRNLTDVEIVVPKLWYESHARISGVDVSTRTVTLDSHLIGGARVGEEQFAPYWLENVFEAMDRPGEFYLDLGNGKLYYLPHPGDAPDTAMVIAPKLDRLVAFEGDPFGRRVEHIRFEGLEFRHAQYEYPPGQPGSVQAGFKLPGAITLRGAENCTLYGCTVSQVTPYAIEFRLGCTRNQVLACHLHDLGGGGVKIDHERGDRTPVHDPIVRVCSDPALGLHVPPDKSADALPPQRVTVSDCFIHDAGLVFPSAVGIWIGDSGGNRILHNEIHHTSYSGISCGWSWVYRYDVRAVDNLIAWNHVHHLNPGRVLSDLGGIYTLGASPGTELRYNLVHDIFRAGYGDWGIYHDGCSSFVFDEGNAAFGCGYGGMFSNFGRQIHARRNILINDRTPDYPAVHNQNDHGMLSLVLEENLLVSVAPQFMWVPGNLGHVRFRENTYASPVGRCGCCTWPFKGEMTPLEELASTEMFDGERITRSRIGCSQGGQLLVSDDADFLDDRWREVLGEIHTAGPRPEARMLPAFADWPHGAEGDRPVLMPLFELDQPMYVEAGQFVPRFHADPGRPLPVRLRLVNPGQLDVTGQVQIEMEDPESGTLGGDTDVAVDIPPGGETTLAFTVNLADGVPRGLVLARMAEPMAFRPAGLFVYPPGEPEPDAAGAKESADGPADSQ
jgi:hypothetical protein